MATMTQRLSEDGPIAAPGAPEGQPIDEQAARVCAHVLDVDLATPVDDLRRAAGDGRYADKAWVLTRLQGEPLGLVELDIPARGLAGQAVQEALAGSLLPRLGQALGMPEAGLSREAALAALAKAEPTAYRQAHDEFIARAPRCSVVICTRDRPEPLSRVLASLQAQDHPNFGVWVIDNAPTSDATRRVVESFGSDLDLRYVLEPQPGLSKARNTAIESGLEGEVVTWIDDDETADPQWLGEMMRAFDGRPDVVAAGGAIVPAELDTKAQLWFEQFGGHSKGRGFTPAWFSPGTWDNQHPLYPLPPFACGASMSFRIDALRAVGGFDQALGAGTLAAGCEDTKMITDLQLAGGTTVWWPTAVTRHYHRRDVESLRRQLYGYGAGLTAYYTAEIWSSPLRLLTLLRLAPRALRDLYSGDSLRVATLGDDFPPELLTMNRRAMLAGPARYSRQRYRNWRSGTPSTVKFSRR